MDIFMDEAKAKVVVVVSMFLGIKIESSLGLSNLTKGGGGGV